jgi:GNAT superfamily N-acetyltransferase
MVDRRWSVVMDKKPLKANHVFEMSIRAAASADSHAIANLVTQLGYPSSAEEIRKRLAAFADNPDYAVWVAEYGGRVVGLTGVFLHYAVEFDGAYGRLLGLVVDEPYRGRGIGKKLLEVAEAWLRERGIAKLTLTSGHQRKEAHEFYRRLGYTETGLRFVKDL